MSAHVEPYLSPSPAPAAERFEDYRALSSAAVASLLIGLLGGVAFLSPYLAIFPFLGMVAGIWALIQVRRRSDELTGRGLAWIGVGLSAFCLFGGLATAAIIYATEMRPDHIRVSYVELQPAPGQQIPPRAFELDGQKVFIKGYMFPPSKNSGITQFLLVRDKGDCCFGGNPKITDRIQVRLTDGLRVAYHKGLYKLHGKFQVGVSDKAVDAGGEVFYHLEADTVE